MFTFHHFDCVDEFGLHDNHSSCPSMLSQMVGELDLIVQSPRTERVYVIEGCDECSRYGYCDKHDSGMYEVTGWIFTPYGPAVLRSTEVTDSGAVKALSSKGTLYYNDVVTFNDASTLKLEV